jgi:hypothetical protein
MKVEERWTFGLLIVMVNLHAYHLCCLLFMVDQGVLALIALKNFMVVGNLWNYSYKEWKDVLSSSIFLGES